MNTAGAIPAPACPTLIGRGGVYFTFLGFFGLYLDLCTWRS